MKKSIICNLSPFNNYMDMSVGEYVLKKLLAFVVIYCIAAVLGEGIIIGILYGMGCDPSHGLMSTGLIGDLLPYYGFIVFALVTVLYCRFFEKSPLKSMGSTGNIKEYLIGVLLATLLLFTIIILCCSVEVLEFREFNTNANVLNLILWLLAFIIQGASEEIMCRGFLLNALLKKVPVPVAIIISSTAFAFPHFSSLFETNVEYIIVGVVNLYLISTIFSMLVLLRSNIWIACGLHSIWNFVLYGIMGLSLSGSESKLDGLMLFCVEETNILNGAEYGIEASIITTLVLGALLFVLDKSWKGRMGKNGI